MKKRGYERPLSGYEAIHMPSNTGSGIILAGLSVAFGVGMIWYMWWLAGLSFIGILAVAIGHTFNYKRDFYIPQNVVERTEGERTRQLAMQG
jgi:cytochrome o ubiquinol oxidase subunit 1